MTEYYGKVKRGLTGYKLVNASERKHFEIAKGSKIKFIIKKIKGTARPEITLLKDGQSINDIKFDTINALHDFQNESKDAFVAWISWPFKKHKYIAFNIKSGKYTQVFKELYNTVAIDDDNNIYFIPETCEPQIRKGYKFVERDSHIIIAKNEAGKYEVDDFVAEFPAVPRQQFENIEDAKEEAKRLFNLTYPKKKEPKRNLLTGDCNKPLQDVEKYGFITLDNIIKVKKNFSSKEYKLTRYPKYFAVKAELADVLEEINYRGDERITPLVKLTKDGKPLCDEKFDLVVPMCTEKYTDGFICHAENSDEEHFLLFNAQTGEHTPLLQNISYECGVFADLNNNMYKWDIGEDGEIVTERIENLEYASSYQNNFIVKDKEKGKYRSFSRFFYGKEYFDTAGEVWHFIRHEIDRTKSHASQSSGAGSSKSSRKSSGAGSSKSSRNSTLFGIGAGISSFDQITGAILMGMSMSDNERE